MNTSLLTTPNVSAPKSAPCVPAPTLAKATAGGQLSIQTPLIDLTAQTLAVGRFELVQLAPQDYALLAQLKGHPSDTPFFELADGCLATPAGADKAKDLFVGVLSRVQEMREAVQELCGQFPQEPIVNFAKSYRTELDLRNVGLAVAPLSREYIAWRLKHPDPRAEYKTLRPNETAAEQCQLYKKYLIENREPAVQKQLCVQLLAVFSPLIVPQNCWISLPPTVRSVGISVPPQPPYIRAELKWKGEWVNVGHAKGSKPWSQLEYTARIHSNTRAVRGAPPSIVIERRYVETDPASGRVIDRCTDRLLAPVAAVRDSTGAFAQYITYDASGNAWISESGFQEASLRRSDPKLRDEALLIIHESHHCFWKEKLWSDAVAS